MSNLILPAATLPRRHEIKLPPIEVPAPLREDLAVNPHMEAGFYKAVQQALDASLRDPDTALREPTAKALIERIEACYNTLVIMRREMNFPLAKCYDLLPQYFQKALLRGQRPEDLIEQVAGQAKAWDKGSAPVDVAVPKDPEADLNREQEIKKD